VTCPLHLSRSLSLAIPHCELGEHNCVEHSYLL
jgi:hypothetical protein